MRTANKLRLCGCLAGILAWVISCGDSQNTDSPGSRAGFKPVGGAALVDYSNYTPTPYTPVTAESGGPRNEPAAPLDPATEGITKEAEAFLDDLAGSLAKGEYRKALDQLSKDARAALSDDKLTAVAATFDKYTLARRVIGEKAGQESIASLDGAWSNTPPEGRKYTVVNANAVQVEPNPLAIVLGPKIGGGPLTLERAAGAWTLALGATPDAAAIAEIGTFHVELQKALDALTDVLSNLPPESAAALQASNLIPNMLAPAIRSALNGGQMPTLALPGIPAAPGANTAAGNGNANGG